MRKHIVESNNHQPIFSILHTSARPHEWNKVYQSWLDSAHDPDCVEYVLVVDHDWGFTKLPTLRTQDKVMWQAGPTHNYVSGVNRAAAASTGRVLIVNADDQYPCQDWDLRLLENIPDLDANYIVLPSTGTPDEHVRRIAVMPILSRTRYLANGYVLYPAYESMFSDNDFLAHARKDNVVIEAKHLLFPHRHPLCGLPGEREKAWENADHQYKVQNREQAYHVGNSVFEARLAMGFSEQRGEIAQDPMQRPKLVICAPGENFSSEWVTQWTEIIGQLSPLYAIVPLFGWSTNVYVTRECLADAANKMNPDYVVWIDDDNIVAPGQIHRLISHIAQGKADITAGWCWLQSEQYTVKDKVSNGRFDGIRGEINRYNDLFGGPDDLVEVGWSGFPIVAMRGDVLNTIGPYPFRPIISDEYPWGMSGEDVAFFYHAKQAGLKVCIDRSVKVTHLKRKPDEPVTKPGDITQAETTPATVPVSQ